MSEDHDCHNPFPGRYIGALVAAIASYSLMEWFNWENNSALYVAAAVGMAFSVAAWFTFPDQKTP